MEWYYAKDSEKVGPLTDSDMNVLLQQGGISQDTLVWNSTMTEWAPVSQVLGGGGGAPAPSHNVASADSHPCIECGKVFPAADMVPFEDNHVCAGCKPVFFQRVREGGAIAGNLNYAGFWIRFLAKIIDGLITGIPFLVYMYLFIIGPMMNGDVSPEEIESMFGLGFYAIAYGIGIAYGVFFNGKYGATPGKMALGLKIVRSDGDKISYLRALGRYFGELLSGLILNIGYIMAAFDREKRGLHDHICDTRVIRK